MWKLEFLPADSHSWVDSLPLGGYPMLDDLFDNARAAREAALVLQGVWPDLRVRVAFVEE